jgi:tRNA nucleotidyltransferase (CCA-adding enzyme)
MSTPEALRRRILEGIRPSEGDTKKALDAAAALGARLEKAAAKSGRLVKAELVGSLAKDTHLAHGLDIDLFLLYPPATPRDILETQALALAERHLKDPQHRYAEHPYVHGTYRGLVFDVVPAYRLRRASGRQSAVDRTPFHTRYVRRHLRARQRDEVRLLKQFLKGIEAYGAETAIGGVSGYLSELLILQYGTFDDCLKAIAAWPERVALSLEGNAQAMGGRLTFLDPVDRQRNAAAGLIDSQFERLRRAASAYIEQPHERFFHPPKAKAPSISTLQARLESAGLIGILAPMPKVHDQARLPHAARFLDKVVRDLRSCGFEVKHQDIQALGSRVLMLIETGTTPLEEQQEHRGPRVDDKANAERFREKWQTHADALGAPFERDGRWWVMVRPAHRRPAERLEARLQDLFDGMEWSAAARKRIQTLAPEDWLKGPKLRSAADRFLRRADPWDP